MRSSALVLVGWFLGSTVAAAEPCQVAVDAPDDARAAIDAWIAAEPSCGPELTVHVMRTEAGFQVAASGAGGRTYARVVPDAQTAAALVASWAADDDVSAASAPAPARVAIAQTADPPVALGADGSRVASDSSWERSVTAAAAIGHAMGVRVAADVYTRGHWGFGIAATGQTSTFLPAANWALAERDLAVLATVGLGARWRGFGARVAVGAGARFTSLQRGPSEAEGDDGASGTSALLAIEASVEIRRELGAGWSIEVGGVLTVLPASTMTISALPSDLCPDGDCAETYQLDKIAPAGVIGVGHRW